MHDFIYNLLANYHEAMTHGLTYEASEQQRQTINDFIIAFVDDMSTRQTMLQTLESINALIINI